MCPPPSTQKHLGCTVDASARRVALREKSASCARDRDPDLNQVMHLHPCGISRPAAGTPRGWIEFWVDVFRCGSTGISRT